MRSALMLVPPAGRESARLAASRIAEDLSGWGARLHTGAKSAERLAPVIAAIAPHLASDALCVLARYSLWTIVLDDRLDAPDADPVAVRVLADQVCRIAAGERYVGPDPVLSTLVELHRRLRAHEPDGVLLARMSDALSDAVRAALLHSERCRQIRCGRAPVPSLAEYLSVGAREVNYRSFAYGLVLLTGQRLPARAVDRIDAALTPACRAVRLANDLRSVDRDRADGRLNVCWVPARAGGAPSVPAVRRYLAGQVRRHGEIVRETPEPTRAALVNSLRVSVGLYRIGDLR